MTMRVHAAGKHEAAGCIDCPVRIAQPVAVAVRTVVARIPELVPVEIRLIRVGGGGAVVAAIAGDGVGVVALLVALSQTVAA